MSADAIGYVFRRSPYRGATFAVHLAMADSVNDQAGYEFWMRQSKLAAKARCGRQAVNEAIARLLADGFLELVAERPGGANRYRFIEADVPVVFDPRVSSEATPPAARVSPEATGGVAQDDSQVSSEATGVSSEATHNPREPKSGTQDQSAPVARDYGFEVFWNAYPKRNGRKVGRRKALDRWGKLDLANRRLAFKAVRAYAAACESGQTIAKDAERFLAADYWRDWLVEAEPTSTAPPRPAHVPRDAVWDPSSGQWVA